MTRESNATLYEETRVAIARFANAVADKSIIKNASFPSAESFEYFLDSLKLELLPELVIDIVADSFLEVATTTPILMFLCEFATALSNREITPVEKQVLEQRCTFLASLPDRLANAMEYSTLTIQSFEASMDLFMTRLCQGVCCFSLGAWEIQLKEETETSFSSKRYKITKENMMKVSSTLLKTLIRRGQSSNIFECFMRLVRNASARLNILNKMVPFLLKVLFECSFKCRGKLDQSRAIISRKGSTLYWSDFISWFLQAAERNLDLRDMLLASLVKIMQDALKTNSEDEESDEIPLALALEHEIFIIHTSCLPTERNVLRLIFRSILPDMLSQRGESNSNNISDLEERTFAAVFEKWGNHDVIEKCSTEYNTTLANGVMYILLHAKQRDIDIKKNKVLQPLLAGVSTRFEIARTNEITNEAVMIASAFASFVAGDQEAVRAFSNLEHSPKSLEKWIQNEENLASMHLPNTDIYDVDDTSHIGLFRRCMNTIDKYPLCPDEAFTFFSFERPNQVKNSHNNDRSILFNLKDSSNHENLVSFGQTVHEKDNMDDDISILTTLRESYNALTGVGRGGNAQLNEVQQSIESGLRGFHRCLEQLKKRIGTWKRNNINGIAKWSQEKIGKDINPMIPSLLPTLMSITIHAPEDRHDELMRLRFLIVVLLIDITPEIALAQLSKMIYASHYGVFQRVEMAKAIAEAAGDLSQVEINLQESGTSSLKYKSNSNRRIYPPIPNVNKPTRSILVSEGKETRRWGSAAVERLDKKAKNFTNYLADVAPVFVSALLANAENDHFAFFRDSDPYAPAEILRSLGTVLRNVAFIRHVAPKLCEGILPFALSVVTRHPLSAIRKQGWILIGELMRSWCGAGPLVTKDGFSHSQNVFGGSLAYIFSEKWMSALQALQVLFEKVRDDTSCAELACLVITDLRDLMLAREDLELMRNRYVHTEKITVSASS